VLERTWARIGFPSASTETCSVASAESTLAGACGGHAHGDDVMSKGTGEGVCVATWAERPGGAERPALRDCGAVGEEQQTIIGVAISQTSSA
jgi:hypothetical protein